MQEESPDNTNNESYVEKVKHWYRALPEKKRYLEFITALLSIPVLLTVVISNVLSLQSRNQTPTPTATPQVSTTSIPTPRLTVIPTGINTEPSPTATPSLQCKKEIGPIEIAYPEENSMISTDPVCLDIVREGTDYCAVVWSYRINGSAWSDYTDKSICMYGLPPGEKKLELRVKSIVTGTETILRRTFTIPSPTPTAAPTSTVTQQ